MKSKIYSSRYMKVSSKGMMWIPAFVTIGFLLAFPVAELIMLGNWFGMGYTAREINAPLCKSVAGWIYDHRTCGCSSLRHCLTGSASSGISIHRGKLISITVFR